MRAIRLAAIVAALALPSAPALAQSPTVDVFPTPGSRVVSPQAQIAFRGVNPLGLTGITVTGSRSGAHAGTIAGDSDGQGGSFLPSQPFVPGESVTVTTPFDVVGAANGTFSFTVASPAAPIPYTPALLVGRVAGDVWRFRSRTDLAPAAVKLLRTSSRADQAEIFLAPQFGPVENGPEILDSGGNLVWFDRVPHGDSAADFRVQQYQGRPVLTWWQGYTSAGIGVGEDLIYDSSYRAVAVVRAANGLSADLHEFQLTPSGRALITAYYPVYWDATSVHGRKQEVVLDSVVQEIDIPTGLVLFQWDSLDHVRVSDSYEPLPVENAKVRYPFDYFHVNSIQLDTDGNLVISGRNTWAAYKINHRTGAVMWTLGGRSSSFRMGGGTGFAFQHDVRVHGDDDRYVTIFDDGAGPPTIHSQSRALKLKLDLPHMTARLAVAQDHSPPLLAQYQGSYQLLPDADDLIGWGQQPYFSEYDPRGRLLVDGRFIGNTSSYRVYKFGWQGQPDTPPDVAASTAAGTTTVSMSWNGATTVAAWRVLAGSVRTALKPVGTVAKHGFETSVRIHAATYVAVQAFGAAGKPLAISSVARAR